MNELHTHHMLFITHFQPEIESVKCTQTLRMGKRSEREKVARSSCLLV
jgi:hypothetical protein